MFLVAGPLFLLGCFWVLVPRLQNGRKNMSTILPCFGTVIAYLSLATLLSNENPNVLYPKTVMMRLLTETRFRRVVILDEWFSSELPIHTPRTCPTHAGLVMWSEVRARYPDHPCGIRGRRPVLRGYQAVSNWDKEKIRQWKQEIEKGHHEKSIIQCSMGRWIGLSILVTPCHHLITSTRFFGNLQLSLALDDGCCRVQEVLGIGCTPGLEDHQSNRLAQCEKVCAQW